MPVTAQQITAAKALAQQRGYDPNLVDADNADRVQTAFPSQGGSAAKPPVSMSALGGASIPAPVTPGGAGSPGITTSGGTVPSMAALNNVVEQPGPDPMSGVGLGLSALGGGAALGNQEAVSADSQSGGMLRGLGARRPPMDSLVLGRKAY
jgi:hypothetical protein